MKVIFKSMVFMSVFVLLSGCSTWNDMSSREKKMVAGAGVGAVAGAFAFEGAVLGTVAGAAVGGLVGDQIGKSSDK